MKKLLFYLMLLIGLNSYSQNITLFDSNFENYLETHNAAGASVLITDPTNMGNGIMDLAVPIAKVSVVTSLNVSNRNISNLIGIQGFTSLQTLRCSTNSIINLNLTGLNNLSTLLCFDNQLTSLNLTGLSILSYVDCSNNSLPNLDLTGLNALTRLNCKRNLLTTLTVSGLNLIELNASENLLTCLDLTNMMVLGNFNTTMSCEQNPNLTCIQVVSVGIAESIPNWLKDLSASYSSNCLPCSTNTLTASATTGTIVCFGGTTTVTVTATGGISPYIGTGSFTSSAGVHTYTVTDANGSSSSVTVNISQPAQLTTTSTIISSTPYFWPVNGLTYSNCGVYTFPTVNGFGCTVDNTLNLSIIAPISSQFINVSTGIDNLGNALPAGSVDSNWQLVSSPNPPGTPALVSDYFPGYWEPTPINSTNAGWINAAGNFDMTVAGIYTFERSFTVGPGTTNIDYNLGIAWDAIPISTEFVRPDGSTIPFVTNPPVSPYYLPTSIPSSLPMTTMAGVWKIRTVSNFTDIYSGFLLSGTITVTTDSSIIPTFTQIAPICSGTTLSPLPTNSTNNPSITGTWSPALNNLATTTYTFTPNAGQCATTTTMTIVVNPIVTPTFPAIASICSGTILSPLPTTSTNNPGITGTWSPALNNMVTTTYTFTPDAGQCATTTTLEIVVINSIINLSTGINAYNYSLSNYNFDLNWELISAPLSGSGFIGNPIGIQVPNGSSWEPSPVAITGASWVNNSGYISGGSSTGICVYEKTITITNSVTDLSINFSIAHVNNLVSLELIKPDSTIILLNPITTTSFNLSQPLVNNFINPMVGDWKIRVKTNISNSPILNDSGAFLLSGFATLTSGALITPTFTPIAPICLGSTIPTLPTTSLNGITGTWSPAISNTATTIVTFTPDAGQCATTTTMEVVVNTVHDISFLDIIVTMTGACSAFNGLYNFDGFLNGKSSFALSTDSTFKISFDGTKWVLWTGNITTDIGFQNTNVPTNNLPPTTGWTATQCVGGTLSLSFPFYNVTSFCAGATVGSITPTLTNINYYTTEFGGTALASSTPLVAGIYYASQTLIGCESNRTTVFEITINPIVTPTFTQVPVLCSTTTISPLPATSNNGITGTWSPVFDLLATTTYTFTPNAGQCDSNTTVTMTISTITAARWYQDLDLDGYGNGSVRIVSCVQPVGYVANPTDCNDNNTAVNPNHVEVPGNGIDDNCDGIIDEVFPTVRVIPQQCGITVTSLWESIFSTTYSLATSYRFEISSISQPYLNTFDTSFSPLYRCSLSNFNGLRFGTTYTVRVAIKVNGFWRAYGPPCTITTPAGIATSLVPQSCGITTSTRWNSLHINPVSPPPGSGYSTTAYRVKVVNNGTIPPTASYLTLTPPPTVFNLTNSGFVPLITLSPNNTYTISVQTQLNGVWQTNAGGQDLYGSSCVLTTSPTYQRTVEVETDFTLVAYPNPYSDEFNLDISTLSENGLEIRIYDMMGRVIESPQATVSDLSTVTFGKNYASGVYNIIVTQGENVKTLRVIKR